MALVALSSRLPAGRFICSQLPGACAAGTSRLASWRVCCAGLLWTFVANWRYGYDWLVSEELIQAWYGEQATGRRRASFFHHAEKGIER